MSTLPLCVYTHLSHSQYSYVDEKYSFVAVVVVVGLVNRAGREGRDPPSSTFFCLDPSTGSFFFSSVHPALLRPSRFHFSSSSGCLVLHLSGLNVERLLNPSDSRAEEAHGERFVEAGRRRLSLEASYWWGGGGDFGPAHLCISLYL